MPVVKMGKCQGMHFYHKECLENQLNSSENKQHVKCAICGISYGKQTGDMPKGRMSWSTINMNLGYPGCFEAIQIHYQFPHGVKNGVNYSGTNRTAYLPNTKDGQEILTLLAECFRRKLTFIVGTSVTTGQSNCVVWSGIHHKTSPTGGSSMFGYPDETYFDRVKDEMAQRGVTSDLIGIEFQMENPR